MKKQILTGLSSLLLPMGLYAVPTASTYSGYLGRDSWNKNKVTSVLDKYRTHTNIDVESHFRVNNPTQSSQAPAALTLLHSRAISELIVIDEAVPDKHLFYQQVKPGVEVLEINSAEDGLLQLENALKHHQDLNALHIVSHADDGALYLGNSRITQATLGKRLNVLATLDHALKDGADVLFYGCDLAKTEKGEELLELISNKARVDVAASNDLTGSEANDADWELEIHKGDIETQTFSALALKEFSSVLVDRNITMNNFTVNSYTEPNTYTFSTSYTARISIDDGDPDANSMYCNDSGGGDIRCYVDPGAVSTGDKKLYFDFSIGQQFDVTSIELYSFTGGSETFTLSSNNGDTLNSTPTDSTPTVVNLNWTGITRLTIEKQNGSDISEFGFDDIILTNIVPPNALPTFANLDGDSYTYTEDTDIQTVLDQVTALTITDGDSVDFNGGNLTVTITSGEDAAEDTLSLSTLGIVTISGSGTTAGDVVSVGGSVVGTLANNIAAGNDLVVNFTTVNATPANVQTLARAITYENTDSDNPTTGARNVRVTVSDGDGGTSANQDVTVTVARNNDVPTITNLGGDGFTYSQGDSATKLDQGTQTVLADVDSLVDFNGGNLTVTITSGEDAAEDQISVDAGSVTLGGTTASSSVTVGGFIIGTLGNNIAPGNDFVVNFGANATPARVQTLIQSVTYENTDTATATAGARNVRLTVNDGDGGTSSNQDVTVTVTVPDSDGDLTAAGPVTEPVALNWSVDTVGEAVNLFDFTLTDGGGGDSLPMTVSQVVLNVTGTANDTDRDKVTWRLDSNAPHNDVSNVTGTYNAGADTITFATPALSIADGTSEILTVNAYYNDNTGLTHGQTIILSVDGDTDLTVGSSNTQMAATSAVNNSTGTLVSDDISPVVTSVGVPANSTYTAAANLDFTVNFNENVTVNTGSGTPRLVLTVGATTRYANFISGSGTSALIFRYTVPAGDEDLNGIAMSATLDPNLGTLRDSASNGINTTLNSVGSLASVFVDALAPVVAEVTPVSTPTADGTPDVTFSSTEAGNLAVGGSCGSGDEGAIGSGNQTITLTQGDNSTALASATYSDCTVTVTDAAGNASNVLALSSFVVDVTDPTVDTNAGKGLNEGDTGVGIANTDLSSSDNISAAANVTYTLVNAPSNGTLRNGGGALSGGGTFTQANINASAITYDHDGSETVSDNFTFTVTDVAGNVNDNGAANFTFTFTVAAVNDAPNTTVDADSTNEDNAVVVDVLANDSDVDGSLVAASVTVVTAPSNGMTSVNSGTGAITYTPTANFTGMDSFTYTVDDNNALSSAATTVTITVNPLNDPPVAVADAANTISGVLVAIDVAANDTDVDTGDNPDPTTIVVVGAASNGTAVFNGGTNRVDYTPSGAFVGVDTFTYTIDDGTGATSNVATVTVTVGAAVDSDGDGVSDFQEGIDGTDPNDANDYLDTTDPVVSAPADVMLDATGLFSTITQRQLLGLAAGATDVQLQQAINALANDNVDGSGCCNSRVISVVSNGGSAQTISGTTLQLPPGNHVLTWQATDRKGNTDSDTQSVQIRPLVSVNQDQVGVEGSSVLLQVFLNGLSPTYPLVVPYTIDGNSTAVAADHNLVNGTVTFTSAQILRTVTINLTPGGGIEGDETLIVNLDTGSINAGADVQHSITITETNVAPEVALDLQQSGASTVLVVTGDGNVAVTATVTDPNPGDTHTYDWSNTSSELMDNDGDLTDAGFTFDPSGLTDGVYTMHVFVVDNNAATDTSTRAFRVVTTGPTLGAGDTDGDGTNDVTEGISDSDSDGIPDYLDNIAVSNVLPQTTAVNDAYLLECEPGLRCGLGRFALSSVGGGAQLQQADIDAQDDLVEDGGNRFDGGLFDFEVHDLAVVGQSSRIVVPQQAAIPASAVYRKFANGVWSDFVEDANNELHSAPGSLGYCPPPGDASWQAGLIAGYFCVQLTIEDGGANDGDGLANHSIEDPGGVTSGALIRSTVKGSGTVDLWLIVILVALIAWAAGRNHPRRKMVMALLLWLLPWHQVQANEWLEKFRENGYLEFSLYQADGSQSRGDLVRGLASDGIDTDVETYDVSRTAYQLQLGYRYHPRLALEVSYLELGDADVDMSPTTTDAAALTESISDHYPITATGWVIAQRYDYRIHEQWSGSVELGLYFWDAKIALTGADISPNIKGDIDPLIGLGVNYKIDERYSARIRWQRLFFGGQEVDVLGIGGAYKF